MGGNISSVNLLTTKIGLIKALEFYRVQLCKQILNVFSHPSLILEGGQVTRIGWCCSVRISNSYQAGQDDNPQLSFCVTLIEVRGSSIKVVTDSDLWSICR